MVPDFIADLKRLNQIGEFVSFFSPPPELVPWQAEYTLFATWIGINVRIFITLDLGSKH